MSKSRTCLNFGYFAYLCLGLIFSLSGLAFFSLEITKIVLFSRTNGELKVNIIDYIYFAQLACVFLYACCCSCCETRSNPYIDGSATTLSLTIYVLYMILTIHEMGDIPFFCPADYPYTSPLIRTACQVRAANLLLLWTIPGISLAIGLVACVCSIIISPITKRSDRSNNV